MNHIETLAMRLLYQEHERARALVNKYSVLTATETDDELADLYASKLINWSKWERFYLSEIERRADIFPIEVILQRINEA